MRSGSVILAALVSAFVSTAASAQETFPLGVSPTGVPPPTGVQFLASGIALSVFGTFSFIAVPICQSAIVIPQEQGSCVTTSIAIGVPIAVTGVSLIILGAVERVQYNRWMRDHPAFRGLGLGTSSHGGALTWSASF
jgi:hypothetical protein